MVFSVRNCPQRFIIFWSFIGNNMLIWIIKFIFSLWTYFEFILKRLIWIKSNEKSLQDNMLIDYTYYVANSDFYLNKEQCIMQKGDESSHFHWKTALALCWVQYFVSQVHNWGFLPKKTLNLVFFTRTVMTGWKRPFLTAYSEDKNTSKLCDTNILL